MTAQEVQDIFRHRHILVCNSPIEPRDFNLETLEMLGSLTTNVSMQGKLQVGLFGGHSADMNELQLPNSGISLESQTSYGWPACGIFTRQEPTLKSEGF
jgi:hypothetical protein